MQRQAMDGGREAGLTSLIFPTYTPGSLLEHTWDEVTRFLRASANAWEVLFVCDGCTDGSPDLLTSWAQSQEDRVRVVSYAPNRGKGYAVRNGMLKATGDWILSTDADLSAPMEEAELLFAAIGEGADIAIGSRWLDRGRQTTHQPLYRQFFGRCFNAITRMVMGLPFADTQCGFKAFRRDAAQTIFRLQTIERWGFDPSWS